MSDPKSIAPTPTEGDLDSNRAVDVMSTIRETAPSATEADIGGSSSSSGSISSGVANRASDAINTIRETAPSATEADIGGSSSSSGSIASSITNRASNVVNTIKATAPGITERDVEGGSTLSSISSNIANRASDAVNTIKANAPAMTERDVEGSSSSGPVNILPSRDATSATSATQQSDNIAHALAGAGGGLLAMTLTYPLITLSTRAQVESKRADTSTLDAVRNIINREGISGLYAGLDSALFGISVTNFVYYYWYEWTRSFFEKAAVTNGRASKKLTTVESILAGAIAGSATVLITNPIWVVNTRMTTRQEERDIEGGKSKKKPSTIGTLLALIKEEGPLSLFAGVIPALVLVINPILQYTFFEQLKNVLEKRRKIGPKDAFFLGAFGKLLATTITYPYITVKSRAHVASKDQPAQGMTSSLKKIVREEGYAGLYKGLVPKVSQSVLTAAFLFAFKDVLYEYTVAARRRIQARKL